MRREVHQISITLWIVIVTIIIFVFQWLAATMRLDYIIAPGCTSQDFLGCDAVTDILGLNTYTLFTKGYVWQIFTYMFTHGGVLHIFYNMFGLLIFGPKIEFTMGRKKFLQYYLISGVGSSIFHILINGVSNIPMVGASGAIFGVMTAYGIMFPRDIIYVQLAIPMPAFLFVIFYGAIQVIGGVASLFSSTGGGIAYFGHIGGMITGIILLKFFGFEREKRVQYFWE